MAVIVIKDLPESVDLDREAMAAIVGGARAGSRPEWQAHRRIGNARLIQYPLGFPGQPPTAPHKRAGGGVVQS
ncbi:hypothetical protein PTE30175_04524 [Pandoraea terrae]|uniref:Uncharacterized protein n=1 Tax=Pandoraea terrae TaxID=1537710 RepID=A0A5E4YMT4_9BURK|nr:hypothetical protein [Pandoraea terrae]VVE49872.1 hypothetical protein PTE30175_04524 [Pandoraea terrae]